MSGVLGAICRHDRHGCRIGIVDIRCNLLDKGTEIEHYGNVNSIAQSKLVYYQFQKLTLTLTEHYPQSALSVVIRNTVFDLNVIEKMAMYATLFTKRPIYIIGL